MVYYKGLAWAIGSSLIPITWTWQTQRDRSFSICIGNNKRDARIAIFKDLRLSVRRLNSISLWYEICGVFFINSEAGSIGGKRKKHTHNHRAACLWLPFYELFSHVHRNKQKPIVLLTDHSRKFVIIMFHVWCSVTNENQIN